MPRRGRISVNDAAVTSAADLDARLDYIATRLLWESAGWVNEAIDTACSLVVAGRETPATLDVCALSAGATLADAGPLLRAMLAEQGVPVPPERPTDDERFAYLLQAFALGVVGVPDFYGEFYVRLPAWDEQSPMQRQVVVLLDDWEQEQDEQRRTTLVAEMRGAVTNASG